MNDIGQWLEKLGLGQYAQVFVDNKIDLEVLPDLTEDDLKDVGIPLGHRKKLLKAIAALSENVAVAGDVVSAEAVEVPTAPSPTWPEAERRQLTVMFCDLVGSTRLSETLDPEDLRDVIRAYQDACSGVIRQFDGFIARYMGDGLLIYFGYPQAHEDDAERAVRTGLGIVEAVRGLTPHPGLSLSVRVGIATGLVVAGDIIGEGAAEERAVLGKTPNLAARLKGIAEPDSVVISAGTQQLVEGLFVYDELGQLRLKGISEPVTAYRLLGESEARSRFEARVVRGLTPLVGRQEELGLLLKRWGLAKEEEGQVVLLSGEAGIGKSRTVRGFRAQLEDEPHSRILYYCSPYYRNSAFYAVIDQLERGLRFERGDGPIEKLDKLEAVLTDLGLPVADHAPHLASLLALPAEGRYPALTLLPEQLKMETIETLLSVFEAMAQRNPVLMVVEDLHWADPSTLELLGLLIERVRTSRIFLVGTFRPEFVVPWSEHAHITALTLNKLSRRESMAMVAELADGKALPDDVLDQILAKTDGVPLFVEELTKTVLESDLLQAAGDRFVMAGPLRPLAIPSSLQDSLMARLDHLAPIKEVAQLAAMLGRSFSYELLAAVSPQDEAALEHTLSDLVAAGLVYQRGLPPEANYEFKHALVQDAAYQLLLKSTRQQYHGRIAEVLEQQFPDTAETQPELLAHHWTEAREPGKAVDYWLKAGRRAGEHSATLEAVAHLERGLDVLREIPDGEDRKQRELALQIPLGTAMISTTGPGSPEVERVYSRALCLCSQLPESQLHFAALWGWWRISMDFRTERDRADRLLELANNVGDLGLLLQAHHCQWATLFMLGDQKACCRHIEEGLKLYDPETHFSHASVYGGHDAKVCALGEAGLAFWLRGYPDQALKHSESALDWAHELNHAGSLVHAMDYAVMLHCYRRDPQSVLKQAEEMIEFSEYQGLVDHEAKGNFFRGWALAHLGQIHQGLADMRGGLDTQLTIGTKEDFPVYFEMLAEVFAIIGQYDRGLQEIEQAMPIVEKKGLRYWAAELHRRQGELLLSLSDDNRFRAEEEFRKSLAVASEQSVKSLELRAACSLVRLKRKFGEADDEYRTLESIYSWFGEGHDTLDLVDAKNLLDRLA